MSSSKAFTRTIDVVAGPAHSHPPQGQRLRMNVVRIAALIFAALAVAAPLPARAADAAFQQWLQALRPQAEQFGISRATFDAATRDLLRPQAEQFGISRATFDAATRD